MFMPKPDTMRLRNSGLATLLVLALLCFAAVELAAQTPGSQSAPPSVGIGSQPPSQPPLAAPPSEAPPPPPPAPNTPTAQPPANVPAQPPGQAQPPNNQAGQGQQGQAPEEEQNGIYVFKARVEEVVLHATVLDEHGRMVTNLDRNDFQVFEDGVPQTITSFRR